MTPTTPIPASLATACAAHDRHRLDVLDALLDEAAPSAVRELLGAALDLCASLRADRDDLNDRLADMAGEIGGLERKLGERRTELTSAAESLSSERAHLAACRTRIAGLEQAADAKAIAVLGPVTLPPAQDRAEELAVEVYQAREVRKHGKRADDATARMIACDEFFVADIRSALASLGAPPTSPPASRPVFAGVSASDLDVAYIGGQRECHQRHQGAIRDCCRYAAVAAVLARLEVSLVAPVDPEAVAKAYHDNDDGPPDVPTWIATSSHGRATAAMRATLTAAGIPVTPEES